MLVKIVVEQLAGEKYRMRYIPEENRFVATDQLSLGYVRGLPDSGRFYGWIVGYGFPPHPHLDALMLTDHPYSLGEVVEAKIIGCFMRIDGDNKFLCIEPQRAEEDLSQLGADEMNALRILYPGKYAGEGWFGVEEAKKLFVKAIPYKK